MAEESAAAAKPNAPPPRRRGLGLSGKLLLLTVLFVMMAEVLIYVPSVANFRLNWLHDRLSAAYTAALVFEAAPGGMVPDSLGKAILDSIGARAGGEDGPAAPVAGGFRDAARNRPGHRHARHVLAPRHHRGVRDAVLAGHRRDAPGGAGAHGWRVHRAGDGRGAAAPRDGGFLHPHPHPFADHLRDLGDARLSCAPSSAGAPDAAHDRQHGGVPRRSGESVPHHRGLRARRRDRHRRARACRHAVRPRRAACGEEPSRRARACGLQDQP